MLLLDSQVALWLVDDNPRLAQSARHLIENAPVVYVSAGTVWELTIKSMHGKLSLPTISRTCWSNRELPYCRSPQNTRPA